MKKRKPKIKTVDNYEKYADIGEMYTSRWKKVDLSVPSNFRMLCAILDVRLEDVLRNFMWMVSYSALKHATDKQRSAARKFFLLCKFGRPQYSKKQVNQMFSELKAIRKIYDTTDGMDKSDKELFWKNNHMYTEYWFKRWFEKNRRRDDISVLEKY